MLRLAGRALNGRRPVCGWSIQGCMMSPVYVYDNLFSGMCDEFGAAGQTIKTGGGAHGTNATAFVMDNLFFGPGSGIRMMSTLGPGKPLTLTVKLIRDRMTDRRYYRGAFVVRTPDGLSRPVSFTTETDVIPPFRCEKPGETAIYQVCGVGPTPRLEPNSPRTFSFEVAKKGRYYFLIHASSPSRKPNVKAGVDGEELQAFRQQFTPYPSWVMLAPGGKFGNTIRYYDFDPGVHTVTVSGSKSVTYDAVVLTDAPGSFEPR